MASTNRTRNSSRTDHINAPTTEPQVPQQINCYDDYLLVCINYMSNMATDPEVLIKLLGRGQHTRRLLPNLPSSPPPSIRPKLAVKNNLPCR
ncbi:hypothetical protein E2C01_030152 [Portunus trituberculatus]|uniref:Uncharacterized protein n=1 Tax=Portunus trituberculatus TaxID=210409 RepID=A0A5B7EWJ3_PORTR|nr:hypothetical protein [Portunus trituberculatus]